jgi:hypothetical protein
MQAQKTDRFKHIDTVAKSAKRLVAAYDVLMDPEAGTDKKIAYIFFLRKEIRILFPRLLRLWLRVQLTKYPW